MLGRIGADFSRLLPWDEEVRPSGTKKYDDSTKLTTGVAKDKIVRDGKESETSIMSTTQEMYHPQPYDSNAILHVYLNCPVL